MNTDYHFNTQNKASLYREPILQEYRRHIGKKLESNQVCISLCADCTVPNNELEWFTKRELFQHHQYVGIDWDESIIARNKSVIIGPEWIYGDLLQALRRWRGKNFIRRRQCSLLNIDLMGLYENEMGLIGDVLNFIGRNNEFANKLLVVFNAMCSSDRHHYYESPKVVQSQIEQLARINKTNLRCVRNNGSYRKGSKAYDMTPMFFAR